jgi:hypothetical protein
MDGLIRATRSLSSLPALNFTTNLPGNVTPCLQQPLDTSGSQDYVQYCMKIKLQLWQGHLTVLHAAKKKGGMKDE